MVAPVLAGFSLAAIATVVAADPDHRPPLADWAIAALALTAACLVFAMQYAFLSLRHSTPPADRLGWNPEATSDEGELNLERERQAQDRDLADSYYSRTGVFYNAALIAFALGLALLMVPRHWSVGLVVAVAVAAMAGLIESAWIVGQWALRQRDLSRMHTYQRWVLERLRIGFRPLVVRLLVSPSDVAARLSTLDSVSLESVGVLPREVRIANDQSEEPGRQQDRELLTAITELTKAARGIQAALATPAGARSTVDADAAEPSGQTSRDRPPPTAGHAGRPGPDTGVLTETGPEGIVS